MDLITVLTDPRLAKELSHCNSKAGRARVALLSNQLKVAKLYAEKYQKEIYVYSEPTIGVRNIMYAFDKFLDETRTEEIKEIVPCPDDYEIKNSDKTKKYFDKQILYLIKTVDGKYFLKRLRDDFAYKNDCESFATLVEEYIKESEDIYGVNSIIRIKRIKDVNGTIEYFKPSNDLFVEEISKKTLLFFRRLMIFLEEKLKEEGNVNGDNRIDITINKLSNKSIVGTESQKVFNVSYNHLNSCKDKTAKNIFNSEIKSLGEYLREAEEEVRSSIEFMYECRYNNLSNVIEDSSNTPFEIYSERLNSDERKKYEANTNASSFVWAEFDKIVTKELKVSCGKMTNSLFLLSKLINIMNTKPQQVLEILGIHVNEFLEENKIVYDIKDESNEYSGISADTERLLSLEFIKVASEMYEKFGLCIYCGFPLAELSLMFKEDPRICIEESVIKEPNKKLLMMSNVLLRCCNNRNNNGI